MKWKWRIIILAITKQASCSQDLLAMENFTCVYILIFFYPSNNFFIYFLLVDSLNYLYLKIKILFYYSVG